MLGHIKPMLNLIGNLKKLPGVGPRGAERIAYQILNMSLGEVEVLAKSIVEAKTKIHTCPICFAITDDEICEICKDEKRDKKVLCVVERAKDVIVLEKTGNFRGKYHVLEGTIAPSKNIGPEKLRINELLLRMDKGGVEEVILALNTSVEGETTSLYLNRLLGTFGYNVTRIAHGIPVGGELEYTDEMTLQYAFEDRKKM